MYLHKSEWGDLYGIFGFKQSFLSCARYAQLFLTRTRYKFLINFALTNPRNLIILYVMFNKRAGGF